jgi:hypothetical protein
MVGRDGIQQAAPSQSNEALRHGETSPLFFWKMAASAFSGVDAAHLHYFFSVFDFS